MLREPCGFGKNSLLELGAACGMGEERGAVMNCRECEPLLVEAAREAVSRNLGTAEGRREPHWVLVAALELAATCPACAERLAD